MFDSGISTRSEVIAKKTEECTELARFTLLCAVVRTIQEWQPTRPPNSKKRDWRVVERNTDNDMQQKQPMQGRPV